MENRIGQTISSIEVAEMVGKEQIASDMTSNNIPYRLRKIKK